MAARNLGRNSIGYEINEDFLPIIKEKLKPEYQLNIFQKTQKLVIPPHPPLEKGERGDLTNLALDNLEIIIQQRKPIDYKKEISKLPYIFKDPVRFDKKIDPKKLRFGSKIDNSDHQRETFYSVKEIISPEIIVLNNDLKVRLIGVKEKSETNGKAIQYLKEKLKGEKVFLKFDATKYDDEGNLLCYLYLKNKTFINAHLIKRDLAEVDTSFNYKYKSKFLASKEPNYAKGLSDA